MSAVEITSGVPIPARGPGRKGKTKYPYGEMQVGDSIYVAGAQASSLQSMARRAMKDRGWRFTARPEADGARLWRVA